MRDRLKEFAWHVYGLKPRDLDYMIQMTSGFVEDRRSSIEIERETVASDDPEHVDDIMDDVAYYGNLESSYLWEFCILRLIGIFEGIIKSDYLENQNSAGLSSRLNLLKSAGYTIEHETEIREWVKLRNAIAHSPPNSTGQQW